jgi:ubiquitin C-terminal hydrolase
MGNDISKQKSEQIINYYIFHKKIDNIIKTGENPLNAQRNEITIYILNLQWIKKWKLYTNYEKVQKELDKINDNDENSLITKLNERCDELIKEGIINNSEIYQPGNAEECNHLDFGNKVLDLKFFKDEVLEALVDETTFISFFGYMEQIFNFKNIVYITGIIKNKIFILMMKQNKKMKLFYKGVIENETKLIQLTAKFPNETIFNDYCQYYKNKNSYTIINKLKEMSLGYVKEMKKDDNCIFTNEFLNLKYLIENIKNNSINFQNIRANFMRLDNISSLPYLNAVIQNIVNIPALTAYLMDESNFDIINKNKNFCFFTCFICRILSNLYYEKNITSFNLEDLNEYIYLRESKFKFDENCIPGDLIKYILETINQEFGQLITNLTQNNNAFYSTIISNTFLCVSGNVIKCISCQNQKTEYNNSFLFEFYLDIIYNRYIDTKYISKKNDDGKYVLKLELCFEYYFNESYYLALDDCFCNSCKKNTEHKIKNYLFSLPKIIIISVNKESDKNNELVLSFPEELNLKKFINNKSKTINYKYNLIGVISHKENRKEYYAFCKHNISNKWYKCSDLNIDKCSNPINEILNQNVDVLIYESFGGSTGSINIQDIIDEKNNTMMSSSSNNSINSMNNDDDNREKIHI